MTVSSMKVLSAAEMGAMDERATREFGVPSLTLMENAGHRVASAALEMTGPSTEVAVFCGRGNNGGDGFVAARILHGHGIAVQVYLLGSPKGLKPDPRVNYEALGSAGLAVTTVTTEDELAGIRPLVSRCALVVDAILGTGFTPPVRGLPGSAISLISSLTVPVLAVDIPSGLSSDSGQVPEVAVRADVTVTFGLPKIGHLLHPASECCGRLFLGNIGFPAALLSQVPASCYLTTAGAASDLLGTRRADSHKGTYGHVLIAAGSAGMTGAAHLCARGALRGGAGLVTIALPRSIASSFTASLPESMTAALPESREGTFCEASLDPFLALLRGKNVIAVGPGLSRHPDALSFARSLIPRLTLPAVIDADGLHALSSSLSVLLDARTEHIMTPHPGEFGRLLGITAAEVQQDRLGLARSFAETYGVVLVLKGSHSLVATPDGEVHFSLTGNAGMAAGGMGDVLTGLIASFVAQGSPPRDAARLGVFLHGMAGDAAAGTIGPRGFLAGEVADRLPTVVRELLENNSSSEEDGGDLRLLIS